MDHPAVFCCLLLFFLYLFSSRKSIRRRPAGQRLVLAAAGIAFLGMGSVVSAEYVEYRWADYDVRAEYDAVMLTGEETELAEGWYAVQGELTYDKPLTLTGEVNLILMDGSVLTMGGDEEWGIGNDSAPFYNLTIYGQKNETGVLKAGGNNAKDLIRANSLTIHGGKFVSESGDNALQAASGIEINQGTVSGTPLRTAGGDIRINGGEINTPEISSAGNVSIEVYNFYVSDCEVSAGEISAAGEVTITGGQVTVEAGEAGGTGIISGAAITLGWKEYSESVDFIKAGGYQLTGENTKVTIPEGQHFTDDPKTKINIFSGGTDPGTLAGRKLVPIYAVTVGDVSGSGTIRTDKEYAAAGEDVTMTFIPAGDNDFISLQAGGYVRSWFEGCEDVTKNPDGSYTSTIPMPRENIKVTAKFGVPVDYVHWDGTTWTHLAVKLTGEETELDGGYYFADKDLEYNFTDGAHLTLGNMGKIYLILADGVTITMKRDVESTLEDPLIDGKSHAATLITYGQAEGTGTLRLIEKGVGIRVNDIRLHGGRIVFDDQEGIVSGNGEVWMTRGFLSVGELRTEIGSIDINGGEVSAGLVSGNIGVEFAGGKVTAGKVRSVPGSFLTGYPGRIILGWRNADDFILADEYETNDIGEIKVFEKEYITDEAGTMYSGVLTADQVTAISGKKLGPANIVVGDEIENGSVETGGNFSDEDNIVTLTAAPAEGYSLKSLTVIHGETEVPWEKGDGENVYTFVMPEDVVPVGLEGPQPKAPDGPSDGPSEGGIELIPADPVIVNAEFGIPNSVTVDPEISNGTVEVSPAEAFEGNEVTLTAVPTDGYVLSRFIVTRTDTSETVTVRNGKFIMPAGNVTVSAVFEIQRTPAERSRLTDFFSLDEMPKTGFTAASPDGMAAAVAYEPLGLTLELPTLSVMADLLQVPFADGDYSIDRLGDFAGMLEGSAVPGEGMSIITAHNHLDAETPGPFVMLSFLEKGDRIFVADGEAVLRPFSVYANVKLAADDLASVREIAERAENALVLITCEDESLTGGYISRRVIFAEPL